MLETTLQQAPDFTFTNEQKRPIHLSNLWSQSTNGIVLVFLRHFGCMFCKDHAAQLRDTYPEFRKRGWVVIAVGQGTAKRSARFQVENHLPFTVLGDRYLGSYALYGLQRGAVSSFLKPGLYASGLRSLARGNLPGKPDGDVSQDPGTFLIDSSGQLLRSHIGQHSGDFPSAATILGWIDAAG